MATKRTLVILGTHNGHDNHALAYLIEHVYQCVSSIVSLIYIFSQLHPTCIECRN
jgi:hypothetical protein